MRADLEALERIRSYWTTEIVEQNERDALVRVTFPEVEMAVYHAVAWCDAVTIVEPDELRDLTIARARQTLERYSTR